ncbi:hypothetical protein BUALT_Bualt03G0060900 [Buddleja alternifolia]|uniref:Transposase n=1 Tax=Buddleja alternifolia TaxID=168488 RepID=A0AAV6XRL3_9LAMI|nr:hypothetical protein BUALT_Bualt03G0060900 [Buddleja alternifolia]
MAQSRASRAAVLGKSKVSEEKNSEVDAMAQSRGAEKGKGKMAKQDIPFTVDEEDSRSEFDDSSDEDYLESDDSEDDEEGYKELVDEDNYDGDEELVEEGNYDGFEELEEEPNVRTSSGTSGAVAGGDTSGAAAFGGTSDEEDLEGEFSDSPSFILDDIEGSSDDDIFLGKNPTKAELLKKLRKFISQSKNQNKNHNQTKTKKKDKSKRLTKGINIREGEGPNQSLHDDWYSDPGEEDELLSLDGSDDEIGEKSGPKHHFFREGEWNMKGKSMVVGMKFENFRVYREALRDYCVRNGFDVEYIRNEAKRVTVTCKNENWVHSYANTFDNKLAKFSYIAKRLEQMIRDNPHVSSDQLRNAISRKYGVEVSSAKVSRAKRAVIDKIVGLDSKQYDLLWDYCETVRARNLGSLILLRRKKDVEPPTFDKMYVMGRDGNDNMVLIAIAVVQVENHESWKWFLSVLLEDIGGMDSASNWTFLSERQKGLIEAVAELAPYAEHRFCVRHMYENFKKRYKSSLLKDMFWRAASSANKHDFEMCMKRIELADPKIDENVKTAA